MLLDHVIGDGKEWVTLEYMDDRPDYYVARVPTGTHKLIEDRSEKWYSEIMPEIEQAIDDESVEFYNERNWREHDKKGYVDNSRKWPIPPYQPCGSSWSEYHPSKETLRLGGKKTKT